MLLKSFNSILEANLAKNILAEHNIIAIVKNRGISFPGGYFGDKSGADLFVHKKDLLETDGILKTYFTNQ